MSDSLIYTLSTFNVWRQHVHIETELLLRIITFKKIKKYALEWNRVWWSPNFYNIIDEIDTIENRKKDVNFILFFFNVAQS